GHLEDSLAWAERGLELGRALDSPEVMIVALHVRGDGRCSGRDIGGLDDLREALEIATARGSASDIVISRTYVAEWLSLMNGPAAGLDGRGEDRDGAGRPSGGALVRRRVRGGDARSGRDLPGDERDVGRAGVRRPRRPRAGAQDRGARGHDAARAALRGCDARDGLRDER